MSISELQLVYQLRKEKREEERKKREQQQQQLEKSNDLIQSRLNTLRQSNMQNAQNLKTIGGAVAHGILAGTSEALTERMLKKQQYNEFLDTIDKLRTEAEFNTQQQQISDNWLRQNYNGLGGVVSFLPQMNATQAGRALNPYINDLTRATGQNAEIVDVNTETGMLTLKNNDTNELDQINLYNLFPGIKSLILKQRSLQNAGFYDDRDLEEQLLRQNQANQQRLDREQQRLDRRENREDEKWAYQRSAMDAQRLQQEQERQHQPESTTQNVVTDDNGNPIIPTENEMKQYDTFITKTANKRLPEIKSEQITLEKDTESLSGILENLNELKALRTEADNDPDLKDTMLLIGRGKYSNKLRELISDLPNVASTLGLNPNMIDFIQRVDKASKKYAINLQSQIARKAMGGASIRSNFEFTQVQEMLPSLFGSKKGFDQHLRAAKSFLDSGYSAIKTQEQALKHEYNEYYISPEEFALQLRQRRR